MLAIRKRRLKRQISLHERNRRRRFARRMVIAIIVLLFLFAIAGVVYAWYMGRNPENRVVETEAPATVAKKAEPYQPPADAAVYIVLQSITTPVTIGSTATVTIKTNPKAVCEIVLTVDKKRVSDTALIPKTADEYGLVQWSWTVEANSGKWPVEMTCANEGGKSGYYKAELEILRD